MLDRPERTGVDTATLKLIVAILSEARHGVSGFWQIWNNALYQLRLIDALLSLPSDTFSFYGLPGRTVVTVDDVANASPTIKGLAQNVQSSTWNSLDLFDLLVRLDDSESDAVKTQVREMLDRAVRVSAELVHMGLLQVPVSYSSLLNYATINLILRNRGMQSNESILIASYPCSLRGIPIISLSLCEFGRSTHNTFSLLSETITVTIRSTLPVFLTSPRILKCVASVCTFFFAN